MRLDTLEEKAWRPDDLMGPPWGHGPGSMGALQKEALFEKEIRFSNPYFSSAMLLPTAYYLPPTTYYLLPTSFREGSCLIVMFFGSP